MKFTWMWNQVYKGLAITFGTPPCPEWFIGWTTREFKERGW